MKRYRLIHIGLILALLGGLLLVPVGASAAGATAVVVEGQILDANTPYWKNGNLPPSKDDWNAWFDASSSTLTLKDADLTILYTIGAGVMALADLTIVLLGENKIISDSTPSSDNYGIYIGGSLEITGSGSLEMTMADNGGMQSCGVLAADAVVISGGTIHITMAGDAIAFHSSGFVLSGGTVNITQTGAGAAIYTMADMRVSGGSLDIRLTGRYPYAILVSGEFKMTGDAVSSETNCATNIGAVIGLVVQSLALEGGTGTVEVTGVGSDVYAIGVDGPMAVSGGHFVLSGSASAYYYPKANPATPDYTIGPSIKTYVSNLADGDGKWRWYSAADGELASTWAAASPFKYIEFIMDIPQTGDDARLWLWLGTAVLAIAAGAGLLLRKRAA